MMAEDLIRALRSAERAIVVGYTMMPYPSDIYDDAQRAALQEDRNVIVNGLDEVRETLRRYEEAVRGA